MNKRSPFKFVPFSLKQKQVLTWWMSNSPFKDKYGLVCDGAVRSGKTLIMSLSFIIWSCSTYNYCNFGMAGKTIGSFKRNVWILLRLILFLRGYKIKRIPDTDSSNAYAISKDGHENYYYIFGGKDERSQDLVQGFTAAGFFFDEVTLMPESFVNQAVARCSVEGAKLWFNCNPGGPYHWFKVNWIDNSELKNLVRICFTLDDNPSLSEEVKNRYKRMFKGVFYKRYILGLWVMAEGIIYDMFTPEKHIVKTEERFYSEYHVAVDYGTSNPFAMGLWGYCPALAKWVKVKEYHWDGRANGQKTDNQYYEELVNFIGGLVVNSVIVDPSAASFIALIRDKGRYLVIKANNDVLDGIRNVSTALSMNLVAYNDCCEETFKEFNAYTWDEKAMERGEDTPLKQFDHHMDSDRYFVRTILTKRYRAIFDCKTA